MARVPSISLLCLLIAVGALADSVTISIPAGNPTVLQEYLCNGSLPSNTTLELQRGVHVITRTGFCIVGTNLKNIRITGAGKSETKVICRGRWGFRFNGAQNVTIEGLAFVDCGTVLYLKLALSASVNNVTFSNSSVYGLALTDFVMSDVDFGACSTCYGYGAKFNGTGNLTLITIEKCTFVGQRIGLEVIGHVVDIRDCSFSGNRAALVANASGVNVSDCSFVGNININERVDGIGVYGAAISAFDMIFLNVKSTRFDGNTAIQGAAIKIKIRRMKLKQVASDDPVLVIKDCIFQNNSAEVGGAVLALQLPSSVLLSKSTFFGNKACIGAAVYAGDAHNEYGEQSHNLDLVDVELIENQYVPCRNGAKGAAVYFNEIGYLNITGTGSKFIGNKPQGAIQGIGSNLHISGAVTFANNSGESGGAIYLTNDAHVYFHNSCSVSFTQNTATRFGGAIYIEGDQTIETNIFTYCAVHFLGSAQNIIFQDNHARIGGHAIYATPIYNCQLEGTNYNGLHPTNQSYYYQIYQFVNSNKNDILSFPVRVDLCSCRYGESKLDTNNDSIQTYIYPGATMKCNVTLLDYANAVSPGVLYAQIDTGIKMAEVRLGPQQEVQWIGNECTATEYQIYGRPQNISMQLSNTPGTHLKPISVTLQPCAKGFELHNDSGGLLQCKCSDLLSSFWVTCDINLGTVNRSGLQWIGLDPNGNEALANICPLKYCKSNTAGMSLAKPADICAGGRIGVLCGKCPDGLSVMFGSADCQKCSNVWLLTILIYAVLGALLVAILFALNLTVTSGILYGFIFYANILIVNSTIFFSQSHLAPLEIIVSFVNLDLGFPLCFYDGMDDVTKTGLQFVFPVYLLVISLTIVLTSHYCLNWSSTSAVSCTHKIRQFIGKRAVNVLATLIYLSYSKVLRTVIDIFTSTTVYLNNGSMIIVWTYDGTIKYLHGKHVVLFLIAIVASVFLVFYTIFLTFIPIIDVCSEKHQLMKWLSQKVSHLKPFNDAYYAPYKGKWRMWLGARLWLVVLLYIPGPFLGSANPSLLLSIHLALVIIFTFIQTHIMPFEEAAVSQKFICFGKYIYNILDLFYLLNYTILALVVSYLLAQDMNKVQLQVVVGVLVGMSVVVFFCSILIHTAVIRCGRPITASLQGEISHPANDVMTASNSLEDNIDELREPLLDSIKMVAQGRAVTN